MQCIEAARLAPSAHNSQPWHFIVVDDPGIRKQVAEATFDTAFRFNRFTLQAPVLIVMVTERKSIVTQLAAKLKKLDFSLIDNGIAAENFCLQAAELGLGTCMIGWFSQRKIRKILKIPAAKLISLVISLGYPHEKSRLREKIRRPVETMFSRNSYL